MALILLCAEDVEPTASTVTCVTNNRICEIIDIKSNNPSSGEMIQKLNSSQYFWKKLTSPKRKIKRTLQRKLRID